MNRTRLAEGFPDQILHTFPPSLLDCDHPLMQALYVTDIGWYPHVRHHFRERPKGADENILLVCTDGEGWAEINACCFSLTRGHALLIPRGEPHTYAADSQNPWSIHWMHFKGDVAQYFTGLLPDGDFRVPVSPACMSELDTLFRQAFSALAATYSHANILFVAQLAHHVLGELFYHNSAYSPALRVPASHEVRSTVNYIVEHCTEPLTRAELARHAGLSVSHFTLLFQRQTGMSPMQFLTHQRVRTACQKMDTTSRTIREIAMEVGYDDPYYFSRVFSQTMGCSPRQYRKTRKG